MNRWMALLYYLVVAAAIAGSDLWTKAAIFELLGARLEPAAGGEPHFDQGREYPLIDDWLSLEATYNLGAFNGSFAGLPLLLVAISIGAVLVTLGIVLYPPRSPSALVWALGLLAGGALGNLYDRQVYGAVRDFVKVFHFGFTWPNFNLADSAICTGVGLLFLRELLLWRQARRVRAARPPEPAPGSDAPEA